MTQEQKDVVEEAADTVHRALDTLEKAELELRNLGYIKADESDPYSFTTDYTADIIFDARSRLDDAVEALRQLRDAEVEEGRAMAKVNLDELKCSIGDKMPESPKALMQRLKLWIDIATENDAAQHIISENGSMNDDLFVLLQLLYVFVNALSIYAETTSTLCLTRARRHILLTLEAELKKAKGGPMETGK